MDPTAADLAYLTLTSALTDAAHSLPVSRPALADDYAAVSELTDALGDFPTRQELADAGLSHLLAVA